MPLPIPNLDDRRFDELVAEAQQRLQAQVPELAQIAPGDPLHALVDVFAWMTESIIYRSNLITERQRRVFLNLLKIPMRPARPAQGLLSIDIPPDAPDQVPVAEGVGLRAKTSEFTTMTELQATPLKLDVVIKESFDPGQAGIEPEELIDQYELAPGQSADTFRPRQFELGAEPLSYENSLDGAYYLAFSIPKGGNLAAWRQRLAGAVINIGLAPDAARATEDEVFSEASARRPLEFQLLAALQDDPTVANLDIRRLPLEIVSDTSNGATQAGVIRIRLPHQPELLQALVPEDPMYMGFQARPPELLTSNDYAGIAFWIRLAAADGADLPLGVLDVNSVVVEGTSTKPLRVVGVGDGQPEQVLDLPAQNLVPESIHLEVYEHNGWQAWSAVPMLAGRGTERVYYLDAAAGRVHCGDGVTSGARWREGARIRVGFKTSSGAAGNVAAGEVKEFIERKPPCSIRQSYPIAGGVDAETLAQAEARIPRFLTHRNRAVTAEDYRLLTLDNPLNAVARCEVFSGFIPGNSLDAVRRDVPGAVSVFVIPPVKVRGEFPRANQPLLRDVYGYLSQRTVLGAELYVLSPQFVPLSVGVSISLVDVNAEARVKQAVQRTLREHLWPLSPGGLTGQGWAMGRDLVARELATQVARVDGVKAVNDLGLFRPVADAWQRVDLIELLDYQLPELVNVVVAIGGDAPEPEEPLVPPVAGVPTPVIPDLC